MAPTLLLALALLSAAVPAGGPDEGSCDLRRDCCPLEAQDLVALVDALRGANARDLWSCVKPLLPPLQSGST